jgi:hypothetical protein
VFFLSMFLPSSSRRHSRIILCIPYPCSGVSHFSKELWFFSIRNHDLGSRSACCYWGVIVSKLISADRTRK